MITRSCTKCGEIKALDEFSPHKRGKYGRQPQCRECVKEYKRTHRELIKKQRKRWLEKNPTALERTRKHARDAYYRDRENRIDRVRKYSAANAETIRERKREYTKRTVAQRRNKRLEDMYGITAAEYDAMAAAQDGCCAICSGEPLGRGNRLHIDHDHASGKIRGLLCTRCNTAIGHLQDSPDICRAAAEYLEQNLPKPKGLKVA